MPNNYFRFKQFIVQQGNCAMKVGTDGVLLGAWVKIGNAEKILDIGTGTGVIALMLAQRSEGIIHAIDIDKDAVLQAAENMANSAWSQRLNVYHVSLHDFCSTPHRYDLIITNPPFFSDSLKAPDSRRSIARHNHSMTHREIIDGAKRLLNPYGRLSLILPEKEYQSFKEKAGESGLYEIRRMLIIPAPGKAVKRIAGEFAKDQGKTAEVSQMIIERYGRHHYSEEYIELTRDFYLKF